MKKSSPRSTGARILVWFRTLSLPQKVKIVQKLEEETRQQSWDNLTEKLSSPFRNNPVSDEEISRLVEEVRQERHDKN